MKSSEVENSSLETRSLYVQRSHGSFDSALSLPSNELERTVIGTDDSWRPARQIGGRSLFSYFEIPFVHKWIVLMSLVASIALGWVALLVWPRVYESEARLLIRVGRESISLDPTVTTGQTLMLQKTQEEEVNSALEMLSSREVAEHVVKRLGAVAILDGTLPSEEPGSSAPVSMIDQIQNVVNTALGKIIEASGVRDPISDDERAVRVLQSSLSIFAPKKSTVVTVQAQSKTPQMAQAIAQTMVEEFLEQHSLASRFKGSQEFFQQQSEASEAKLNELVDRRTKFLQNEKIVSIDANRSMLRDQLGAIDRDIAITKGEMEQATAEITDLENQIKIAVDEVPGGKEKLSDATWSGMRQSVYDLELLERNLTAMYPDDHPKLIQVREQLQGGREILEKLDSSQVNMSTVPNPIKRRMEDDLQQLQTKIVGLKSILREQEKQRQEMLQGNEQLHDFDLRLSHLDREIALLDTSLAKLREKQEEARVIDELQDKHFSNISTFQPANFVERPISPKKPLIAAGFVMFGLLAGFGWAFLRELNSTFLRTAEHVESIFQWPVIAKIPYFSRAKAMRTKGSKSKDQLRIHCQAIIAEVLQTGTFGAEGRCHGRTLGVLGVEQGNGASTIAATLAIASSEDCGLKTTLVDADTKNRTVSKIFGLNGAPGLAELVAGEASAEQCIQPSGEFELDLVSCCSSDALRRITSEPLGVLQSLVPIQQQSDLVIVDLPSASTPDSVVPLSRHLDQLLIVVESEKTGIAQAERLVRRLRNSQTEIVGVVLNKSRNYVPSWRLW